MTRSQKLDDEIETFLSRPLPDDLDPWDFSRVRADRQGTTLAHLLGALTYFAHPGAPALTKTRLAEAVSQALDAGIRMEQDDLARIAQRHPRSPAAL